MCWSGEASTAVAVFGFATTAYLAHRKESMLLWVPIAYFTLMEALQAYTYSVIDKCGMPANQIATLLGYIHIAFQPFFVNMFSLYFIDKRVAQKIAPIAYTVCAAAATLMLLKLYPFAWSKQCIPGLRPMCGDIICAFHGNWHIAWHLPINNFADYIPAYAIAAFIMPFLYGSWRFTIFQLLAGPVLARLTTSNMDEWPAVWCLFSIDLLLIATTSRFRKHLVVKNWWLWPKAARQKVYKLVPADDETVEGACAVKVKQ